MSARGSRDQGIPAVIYDTIVTLNEKVDTLDKKLAYLSDLFDNMYMMLDGLKKIGRNNAEASSSASAEKGDDEVQEVTTVVPTKGRKRRAVVVHD